MGNSGSHIFLFSYNTLSFLWLYILQKMIEPTCYDVGQKHSTMNIQASQTILQIKWWILVNIKYIQFHYVKNLCINLVDYLKLIMKCVLKVNMDIRKC